MGGILPGSRHDYRTTPGMFKWIVLIAIIGSIAFAWILRIAVKDANQIYKDAGYSDDLLIIKTNKANYK